MPITPINVTRLLAIGSVAFLVAACDTENFDGVPPSPAPPSAMTTFEVTTTNLTNAQPLSPAAVIAHQPGYSVFEIGTPATVGLEVLAEGGDNSALIAGATASAVVVATATGAAPIGPAGSETIAIDVPTSELSGLTLSTSTMLVNTNDAITGINGVDVSSLAVGDSFTLRTIAYDAGTEANTEAAVHIPGPAGGGEGFNGARDDVADRVAMHSGVVTQDDGKPTSDLNGQHRFDNPVAAIRIERIN
jgi:hypothetical protein